MAVSLKQFYEELYEEHLEEGAYLYDNLQPWREDPEGSWTDCAELEARLEAHIDALVIGEDCAKKVLRARIDDAEAGDLFVITCVFCRFGTLTEVNAIWESLIGSPEELKQTSKKEGEEEETDPEDIAKINAVAYALRLEYPEPSRAKLPRLLESPHGSLFPIIASSVDELTGFTTKSAKNLLHRSPLWYLPEAARLLGNAGNQQFIPLLEPLLNHKDAAVKKEAAIALLKLGHFDIVPLLLEQPDIYAIPLAFSGDRQGIKILLDAANTESPATDVLYALGFSGQLAAVKPLVLAMSNEDKALAAANAAQLILATNLVETEFTEEKFEQEDLFEEELEAFSRGEMPRHPSGEAYGESIEKIVTDPERWREWLRKHRKGFDTPHCYRLGEPLSPKSICRSLYQPEIPFELRRYIHDELTIRFRLNIPFTVFDPVDRQRDKLQKIVEWVDQWGQAGNAISESVSSIYKH